MSSTQENSTGANQTKSSNIAALCRTSGREWHEWLGIFEAAGATKLSHPEIARIALKAMPAEVSNPEWWAQAAAIAFEQHAAIRVPGQSSTGDFRVGASRTIALDRDAAIERWKTLFGDAPQHLGHTVHHVRESRTEKRTFWRATLEGAGKLEVAAEAKAEDRAIITIQLTGLGDADQIEAWRAHWKQCLGKI